MVPAWHLLLPFQFLLCFYYASSKSLPNNTVLLTHVQCEISIMNCSFVLPHQPVGKLTNPGTGTGTGMTGCDWRILSIIQRLLSALCFLNSYLHGLQIRFFLENLFPCRININVLGWILTEKTTSKLKREFRKCFSYSTVWNESGLSWSCYSFWQNPSDLGSFCHVI